MQSDLPKVLHPIAGVPMLIHAMDTGASLAPARKIIVAGHGADMVRDVAKNWDANAEIVVQSEQLGTGHAVAQAKESLAGFEGDAIVLFGDTPFISDETLQRMSAARKNHDIVILGFVAADPGRYGRLVMQGDELSRIVEFNDADAATRDINLCNSGVVCADAEVLLDLIAALKNDNAAGEFYLTDIVEIGRARGLSATAVTCDESETLGINARTELAAAEEIWQSRKRAALLRDGVTMPSPQSVHLHYDTIIGRDTLVEPNVVFGPSVTVESGATIRAFSHLEGCHVSRGAVVGPYARLRPGAELAENVKIGNFVEVKNAQIAEGAKVNHLSYVGDAEIGSGSNVGAGVITCNYDGVFKHKTTIGERVFVGSNTMLVAPVTIGDDAMTATGSVITRDVPAGDLAVARARQENKPGFARRMFDKLRKLKASQAKET